MTEATVIRHPDKGALAADVATRLLELIADLQAGGRIPQVVLTGGGIADQIHREVARLAADSGVDWGAVSFWWGDERFVPAASDDRNAKLAREAFLDAVGATRVHEMPASDGGRSLDDAAQAYGEEIRNDPDGERFDVVMLGMGPDGHVASLFPDRPEVDATDAIAVPVRNSPKPPPERISLTREALCRSDRMWFVVDGALDGPKADATERALAGDQRLPAARVHADRETIWFLA